MRALGTITRWVTVWLAACLLAAPAQAWRHPLPDPAGTWQGHAPAADAARRVFTLQLAQNGTAVWETLYIGKDSVTQPGHWTRSGSQIVLNFDAVGANRPLLPITFHYFGRQLHPVDWDMNEWGKTGPPNLYRSSEAAQGGS